MKKVEKIDVRSQSFNGEARRYLKRRANKLIRKLGKLMLEDAPKAIRHVTRGWVS